MSTKATPVPKPLTDPRTGKPLPPREQPGYYPGFSTLGQKAYWDVATRRTVIDRVEKVPPYRFFSPAEQGTLLAAVARLVPQEDRIPSRRIPILPFIDKRLFNGEIPGYRYEDMPPDPDAYRIGSQAFEQMAQELYGAPFHELTVRSQEEILQSVHDGEPKAAREFWKKMNISRFWALILSDCLGVYYAHPWAWDEVGFGGPAYPRAYMRLEEGEAEPWEVEERRYEWAAPIDTLSDKPQEKQESGHQSHPAQGGTH